MWQGWRGFIPALVIAVALFSGLANAEADWNRASFLPDISGLAWVRGDTFVAVHDAKNPEEAGLPRASLVVLPEDPEGIRWRPLELEFPGEESNDFESSASIPGTGFMLLVESTEQQEAKPFSRRVFLAGPAGSDLAIMQVAQWPVVTRNIEATAVARVGGQLVFVFAERNQGKSSTDIRWAKLELDPLRFGEFRAASFTSPGATGPGARPVSALDIDSQGRVYLASAYDPGNDNGPFRSSVYRAGTVALRDGEPVVLIDAEPLRVAQLDGLKVESVAASNRPDGTGELILGIDDENYGGTLRPVLLDD